MNEHENEVSNIDKILIIVTMIALIVTLCVSFDRVAF
jgi:hypothetical protein